MFNKIREKRYIERYIKKDLSVLNTEIEDIRNKSDIIAICPTPTGPNWQGVMHATLSLFPENTFVIPQYYSSSVYSENELKLISKRLNDLVFNLVIFSGFPEYFGMMLTSINSSKTAAIFHGALSEITNENNQLRSILKLAEQGKINRIGFIKKGLSEYFNKTCSAKCFELPLSTRLAESTKKKAPVYEVKIGVFGNSGFNKNIHNQVAAALLIDNSKVHVICDLDFSYLDNNNRIVKYGNMQREDFLELLGSMSLNLHCSFSESWGQIVTESLSLGVPCLTSNNNGIFDYDDYLAEKLIIDQYDNPIAISKQLKMIFENYAEISIRGIEYVRILNNISDLKLKDFIHA